MSLADLEYIQYDYEARGYQIMADIREKAVAYAMHELAIENVVPDVDFDADLPLLEQELCECTALYRGKEVADEVKRLFVLASITH